MFLSSSIFFFFQGKNQLSRSRCQRYVMVSFWGQTILALTILKIKSIFFWSSRIAFFMPKYKKCVIASELTIFIHPGEGNCHLGRKGRGKTYTAQWLLSITRSGVSLCTLALRYRLLHQKSLNTFPITHNLVEMNSFCLCCLIQIRF